jgi:hypothetical protein
MASFGFLVSANVDIQQYLFVSEPKNHPNGDARVSRDAFARSSSPEEQKKIATEIQKESLRPGDLYSPRAISGGQRVAEIALRRARRSCDTDLLEYRQVGLKNDCSASTNVRSGVISGITRP